MSLLVQSFCSTDLEAVDGVLQAAFKTTYERKDNLKRYLEIQSCGPFVAKIDGEVVGFGAAMDYGPFAYIGKMGVDPRFQRRGIGGSILSAILGWLEDRKCPTALLDASQYGGPLYEKFGFVQSDLTAVMQRQDAAKRHITRRKSGTPDLLTMEVDFSGLLPFDKPRFGADRLQLLRSYFDDDPSRFLISQNQKGQVDGFVVAQSRVIGPWVASTAEVAETLLKEAMDFTFEEDPTVFVSTSNAAALKLLSSHGFELQRTQRHMWKGRSIQRDRAGSIYGQANFSFG
jgi:ribosomal protein S18 acetylase RimI-like enzyme